MIVLVWLFIIAPPCLAICTFFMCYRKLIKIHKEAKKLNSKIVNEVDGKNIHNLTKIYNISKNETKLLAKHIERYYQAVFANQQVERILEPGQYLSPALLLNNYGYRKFAKVCQSINGPWYFWYF